MYFWNFQTFIWATRVQAGWSGGNDNWHAILRKNHKKVKSHKGWVMYWKETFYEFDQVGFELITNNSNSNTFDVSLLKYYITNN